MPDAGRAMTHWLLPEQQKRRLSPHELNGLRVQQLFPAEFGPAYKDQLDCLVAQQLLEL